MVKLWLTEPWGQQQQSPGPLSWCNVANWELYSDLCWSWSSSAQSKKRWNKIR